MPSPDVSAYVDLTLFDLSSQQIFLDAIQYARIALPEFQPTEGSIETTLLEAMALEVQELVTSINRLPGGIVQALLGFLEIPRIDAATSTGLVKITSNQSIDTTIPGGVRFSITLNPRTAAVPLVTTTGVQLSRKQPIATLQRSSNVATVTTVTHHGLSNGQSVVVAVDPTIAGVAGFNATLNTITVTSTTTFTYVNVGSDVSVVSVAQTATYVETQSGNGYGFVEVSTSVPGYSYFPLGTPLTLTSAVSQIGSASLATNIDGGYDAESDADFFQRASASLNRMTSALVTADQISQYVASRPEFQYVYRVKTIDNCTQSRLTDMPGRALTVVARLSATNTLQIASTQLEAIKTSISPYLHPALRVYTDNAFLCEVAVYATVVAVDGISGGQAQSAIQAALTAYISPDSWDWEQVLQRNELIHIIRSATYNGIPVVASVRTLYIVPQSVNAGNFVPAKTDTFTATRSNNVLTLTIGGSLRPLYSSTSHSYVAIRVGSGSYSLHEVTGVTGNTFTINQTGADTVSPVNGDWILVAERILDTGGGNAGSGDTTFYDPAPLLRSGNHTITVL